MYNNCTAGISLFINFDKSPKWFTLSNALEMFIAYKFAVLPFETKNNYQLFHEPF